MNISLPIIAGYARTPFVRFCGAFASLSAVDLGSRAIAAALDRAGVSADEVDLVVGGQVLQAGAGQNPIRQSAVAAGIPLTTPALTVNAVCLSGTLAVAQAAHAIARGEARVVVAVGQESMSSAPHVQRGSRLGTRYGAIELVDSLAHDGLTDAFEERSMGASTEDFNGPFQLTRVQQDAWAARSHTAAAAEADLLAEEIVPVAVPSRRGEPTVVMHDDGVRPDTTTESLARLRPAFSSTGTITAGNSSQISDGAAAIVLVAPIHPSAARPGAVRVLSTAFVAGPDVSLHRQPAQAIAAALDPTGRAASEVSIVEINEAFAAVAVESVRTLGVDQDRVNRAGGAIALGHPIGASGTRIVGTLARQLASLESGAAGAAGICGGGGQGAAVVLERV
ncbi:acetyl-CoA C-acyltransferase [Leifsonia sp. NPDC058194]|uniref:acetyl-CoA C-acyltransferase n=1 Tax=Leifsonia sp. NPDC058194 TaxID=3346374 RepID=UPI0036D7924A